MVVSYEKIRKFWRWPQLIITIVGVAILGSLLLFFARAATNTVSYSGRISTKKPTASYSTTPTASGTLTAQATVTKLSSATLSIVDASGNTLASQTTNSGSLTASTNVVANTPYTTVISGSGQGNYTLNITYPTPDVPLPDTTQPTVRISAPTAGSTVSGSVAVNGSASDNTTVAKVEVSLDNGVYQAATATPPLPVGSLAWTYSLDTTQLSNGSHSITVRATDSSNNVQTATESVTVNNQVADTTPPTAPTNLSSPSQSTTSIALTWSASTDNVGVTSYDVYRNNAKVGSVSVAAATSYTDSGLTSGTSYTYYVIAKDAAGNSSPASSSISVKTATPADTTPPSVTIASPVNGATVSGTINVVGTASDNVAVSKVELSIDNGTFVAVSGTASWSYSWNTTTIANGTHSLTVRVTDSSNNQNATSVSVNVSNTTSTAPTVSISSPSNGSTINGTTLITGDLSSGVTKFTLQVSGNGITPYYITPYSMAKGQVTSWKIPFNGVALPAGTYTLTAVAYSGTQSATTAITVNVKGYSPPTAIITSPASGATLSGTVTVSGSASSAVGLDSVSVQLVRKNSTPIIDYPITTSGTTTWSGTVDTTKVPNGTTYNLIVVARDSFGYNHTSSVPVTVANNVGAGNPVVTITSPANGSTASGIVTMTGTASGTISFLSYNYSVTTQAQSIDGVANWTAKVNTAYLPNGPQTISVNATDTGSVYGSASVTLNVSNPAPTVAVTSPVNNATVSGILNLSGTANDTSSGIDYVLLSLDGDSRNQNHTFRRVSGTTNWTETLSTYGLSNGTHTITLTAYNKAGTPSIPVTVTVNVQNTTLPTSSIPCDSSFSANPEYDHYTSADGVVDISLCTLQNGWTAEAVYNVLKAISSYPGIPELGNTSAFAHLSITVADSSTTGNGGMGTTTSPAYSGNGNNGGWQPIKVNWQCGSTSVYTCFAHEYGHAWFFAGEYQNPANWTGSDSTYQPYGYPKLDNVERSVGVFDDPTLKTSYESGDGNDTEANTYRELFACPNSCPEGEASPVITGMEKLPTNQMVPGWLQYLKTGVWL